MIVKYIKTLSDLLMIFLTVNFFLSLMKYTPASGNIFMWAAVFSLILSLKIENKHYKTALGIFILLPVIIVKTFYGKITAMLIFAVIFYLHKPNSDKLSYGEASDGFKKSFVFILIMLVISCLSGSAADGKYILPYAFSYLAVSVLQLRYLRNYEYNAVSKNLNKINMVYLIFIIILTFISALDSVRQILLDIIKFLYDKIMNVFVYVLSGFFYIIYNLLSNIKIKKINPNIFKINQSQTNSKKIVATGADFAVKYPYIYKIIFILSNIMLIILVIYIIIKLLGRKEVSSRKLEKYNETKEFIFEKKQRNTKKRSVFRDNSSKIRYYYYKLMKDIKAKGISIKKNHTTMDIYLNSKDLFNKSSTYNMRNIYREIRYGNKPCDKEKVKEFIGMYKKRKL